MNGVFKIGNNDYTNNIINGTYDVSNEDVYEEWTDANLQEHRLSVRTRITGSFDMYFRTEAAYEAFLNDLSANKQDGGYWECSLLCNDTNAVQEAELFIKFRSVLGQKQNLQKEYGTFTVEVRER